MFRNIVLSFCLIGSLQASLLSGLFGSDNDDSKEQLAEPIRVVTDVVESATQPKNQQFAAGRFGHASVPIGDTHTTLNTIGVAVGVIDRKDDYGLMLQFNQDVPGTSSAVAEYSDYSIALINQRTLKWGFTSDLSIGYGKTSLNSHSISGWSLGVGLELDVWKDYSIKISYESSPGEQEIEFYRFSLIVYD